MLSTPTLLAFSGAALLLLIVPGPAVMYIVTRSATQGRTAGLVSVLGIHVGTLVHVVAAVAGLSAVLAASATAFTAVKLAGAAYLVWLGVQALRSRGDGIGPAADAGGSASLRRVFVDGIVLNILNPKTALFFLSFVPQFIDAGGTATTSQLLLLSAIFIGLGLVTDGAYAVAGGWVGGRLRRSERVRRRASIGAGVTYLGLGAITAASGGSSS